MKNALKKFGLLWLTLCVLLFASCGDSDSDDSGSKNSDSTEKTKESDEKTNTSSTTVYTSWKGSVTGGEFYKVFAGKDFFVEQGKTAVAKMKVTKVGTNNWETPIVFLRSKKGSGDYAFLRSDNYGWKTASGETGELNTKDNLDSLGWNLENNWLDSGRTWSDFLNFVSGANLTVKVTYGNTLEILFDFEKGGESRHQYYKGIPFSGDLYVNMVFENCDVTFDEISENKENSENSETDKKSEESGNTEADKKSEESDSGKTDDKGETETSNSDEEEGERILWYDKEKESFEAYVVWQATNDLEKTMLMYVDSFVLKIIDPNGIVRKTVNMEKSIDTKEYKVIGTYSIQELSSSEILKWSDIPKTTVEAELKFTTGTSLTVVKQNGLLGPGDSGKLFSISDFFIKARNTFNTVNSGRIFNYFSIGQMIAASCMNDIRESRAGYGDYKTKEFPVVKVKQMEITVSGKKYVANIDWTDENLLNVYARKVTINGTYDNGTSGYGWRNEFTFQFMDSDGSIIGFSDDSDNNYYLYIYPNKLEWTGSYSYYVTVDSEDEIEKILITNPNDIAVKILSTTGTVYNIQTTMKDLFSLPGLLIQ